MKTYPRAGFTLVEVVLVIVVAFILIGLLLPSIGRGRRSTRIHCNSNLKQIGLAFRMWANDHNDRFPMQLTLAQGGTQESALRGLPLASFKIISNELNSPKPLNCPEDKKRTMTRDFAQLTPKNLSYFLGLDAAEGRPNTILTGDRNLCINTRSVRGLVQITNSSTVTWSPDIHKGQGNLGLADGSAYQVTDQLLQKALQNSTITTNRFAIP